MPLEYHQRQRYARHLSLGEIGEAGQERLLAGRVLVVGAGGLGSPAALYLAAAGIGTIGLMYGDRVEISNLQRQLLHATPDVGRAKVDSAAEKLMALNSDVTVQKYAERLTADNAGNILKTYDFVIDATDNGASKFLIADVCQAAQKPYSHAGIQQFRGQTLTVLPGRTACLRCAFDVPPSEDASSVPRGPLGAVPGVIGAIQATEAIKYLLGIGKLLVNTWLIYDSLLLVFRRIPVHQNPHCRLCGKAVS